MMPYDALWPYYLRKGCQDLTQQHQCTCHQSKMLSKVVSSLLESRSWNFRSWQERSTLEPWTKTTSPLATASNHLEAIYGKEVYLMGTTLIFPFFASKRFSNREAIVLQCSSLRLIQPSSLSFVQSVKWYLTQWLPFNDYQLPLKLRWIERLLLKLLSWRVHFVRFHILASLLLASQISSKKMGEGNEGKWLINGMLFESIWWKTLIARPPRNDVFRLATSRPWPRNLMHKAMRKMCSMKYIDTTFHLWFCYFLAVSFYQKSLIPFI